MDVEHKDPNRPINTRIRDLMRRMTLEEKIAQMMQLEKVNATSEILWDYSIDSVLSGGGSLQRPEVTTADCINMVNAF
ncbi:beta-glucosidase [Sarracenia purpurea var. burkii]